MTDSSTHMSTPPRPPKMSPNRPSQQHHSEGNDSSHTMHTRYVQTSPALKPARKQPAAVSWAQEVSDEDNGVDLEIVSNARRRRPPQTRRVSRVPAGAGSRATLTERTVVRGRPSDASRRRANSSSTSEVNVEHRPVSATSQRSADRMRSAGRRHSNQKRPLHQSSRRGPLPVEDDFVDVTDTLDSSYRDRRDLLEVGRSPGLRAWDAIQDDYGGDGIYGKQLFDLVDELEDVSSLRGGNFLFGDDDLLDGI